MSHDIIDQFPAKPNQTKTQQYSILSTNLHFLNKQTLQIPTIHRIDTMSMSLQNIWHLRRVADTAAKACYICYKPSSSVLITPDNRV